MVAQPSPKILPQEQVEPQINITQINLKEFKVPETSRSTYKRKLESLDDHFIPKSTGSPKVRVPPKTPRRRLEYPVEMEWEDIMPEGDTPLMVQLKMVTRRWVNRPVKRKMNKVESEHGGDCCECLFEGATDKPCKVVEKRLRDTEVKMDLGETQDEDMMEIDIGFKTPIK